MILRIIYASMRERFYSVFAYRIDQWLPTFAKPIIDNIDVLMRLFEFRALGKVAPLPR